MQVGNSPHPVTVTARIMAFLAGNPYKQKVISHSPGQGSVPIYRKNTSIKTVPMNPITKCFAELCIHVFTGFTVFTTCLHPLECGFLRAKKNREKHKIETFELWKLRMRYDDEADSVERQVSAQSRVFV